MFYKMTTLLAATALAAPAMAQDLASGDADEGERVFNQCKSCHMIVDDEGENIVRGGRVGPNLYGVVGRTAGTYEDYRYSDMMVSAGEGGLAWDEESFVAYVQDPNGFLQEQTGESGRAKMTFRARSEDDALNAWAYLVSVSPAPEMPDEDMADEES